MKKKHRMGNEFVHVAVDDASRVAYVEVLPNERGDTCARFLLAAAGFFASRGVRIERVLTDRAWAYRASQAFPQAIDAIGAQHKLTRPYRPQTNGKAERFIQTMLGNGLMPGCTTPTQNAWLLSLSGWSSIITGDPTWHSEATHQFRWL